MPIKVENRAKYPKTWPLISTLIRKYRAANNCECSGECGTNHAIENTSFGLNGRRRCLARNGERHPFTGSRVVLTVAHLNQNPADNGEQNLMALCQRCHNRLDSPHRQKNARKTRRAKKAVGELV